MRGMGRLQVVACVFVCGCRGLCVCVLAYPPVGLIAIEAIVPCLLASVEMKHPSTTSIVPFNASFKYT